MQSGSQELKTSTTIALNVLTRHPSLPSAELVDRVINIAKKNFQSGFIHNKAMDEKVNNDFIIREKFRYSKYVQPRDDCFPYYNANRIQGTHLVAACGPFRKEMVGRFFDATVFNEKKPVMQVLALGTHLSKLDEYGNFRDFFDYCSGLDICTLYDDYKVISTRINGNVYHYEHYKYTGITGILNSKLKIYKDILTCKELTVTVYPLEDMFPILLDSDVKEQYKYSDQNSLSLEARKKTLFELYQSSLKEPLLIHCHSGFGRTGHVILMFEILREFDRIWASGTDEMIAAEIQNILNRIRESRSGLVYTEDQFTIAIKNAIILKEYEYTLKNEVKDEKKPVVTPTAEQSKNPGFFAASACSDTNDLVDVSLGTTKEIGRWKVKEFYD